MKNLLRRRLPGLRVLTEVSYRELTTLGVGSRLPLLAEPASVAELAELIKLLKREHIAYFVFGGGSNVVGMDSPYRGVGIRLAAESFSGYVRESNLFYCGAQVKLPVFAAAMANLGMSGVSKLIGIPGTLGGAVRMNAGTAGTTIGEAVRFVEGIDGAGNPWKADAAELSWNYRSTSIPGDVIITRITLELAPGSVEAERAIIADELAARRRREPEGRTAGCAFRNVSDLEPAGLLIDRCGLRGFRIGDVEISPKHANYLLNHGSASEADYLEMIKLIRRCGIFCLVKAAPCHRRYVRVQPFGVLCNRCCVCHNLQLHAAVIMRDVFASLICHPMHVWRSVYFFKEYMLCCIQIFRRYHLYFFHVVFIYY